MTERLILLIVLAAVTAAVIYFFRRRPVLNSRSLTATGLPPGTYLLTSDGCDTCERARETLTRRGRAYTELSWQKNPDVFERLQIDAVPSVIVIEEGGDGRWWRGGVPRRL
jgi:glutaredoxin